MEEGRIVGPQSHTDTGRNQPMQRVLVAVPIQSERHVAAWTHLQNCPAARQFFQQPGILGRAYAVADPGHRQVANRRPDAFGTANLTGVNGAAIAMRVSHTESGREIYR